MPTHSSPRQAYEAYLKGEASFEDVEAAAQRSMDRYESLLRASREAPRR